MTGRTALEFVRFMVVGCSGIGVNLGAYYVLTRLIALPLELASPAAIEASIVWNFLLNDSWTFRQRVTEGGRVARVGRFHAVCLVAGGINYVLLLLLTRAGGWWDIYANLFGIVAGGVAKFAVSSAWTWREQAATGGAAMSMPQGGMQ